jgi:outer membrane protein
LPSPPTKDAASGGVLVYSVKKGGRTVTQEGIGMTTRTHSLYRHKILKVLGISALMGLVGSPAFAVNVAVVDVQKVLEMSDEGQRVKSILEKEVKARQELITKQQTDLKTKKEKFDKESLLLKPDKKMEEQGKLEKELVQFQQFVQQSDMEIQKRQMELMQPVLEQIRGLVQKIGSAEKFDLVIEKNSSGVLYSRASEDITDRVILQLKSTKK